MALVEFTNNQAPYINAENLNNNFNELNNKIKTGTWTPALSNSANDGEPTVNYRYQSGDYIKIGNLVIVFFRVSGYITAVSGSNYASIKGLPFVASSYSSMGAFSSVYNLVNGSEIPTLTALASPTNQIGLLDANNLGSSIINYKLSGSNYFECFGGIAYITEEE